MFPADLIVTTGNDLPGHSIIRMMGVARGIIVRSPTISQGFLGGFKQLVGGNIDSYSEMCEQARKEAYEKMVAHARSLGGNAVLAMRYESSSVGGGQSAATEVLCYGTAVVCQPNPR